MDNPVRRRMAEMFKDQDLAAEESTEAFTRQRDRVIYGVERTQRKPDPAAKHFFCPLQDLAGSVVTR